MITAMVNKKLLSLTKVFSDFAEIGHIESVFSSLAPRFDG